MFTGVEKFAMHDQYCENKPRSVANDPDVLNNLRNNINEWAWRQLKYSKQAHWTLTELHM